VIFRGGFVDMNLADTLLACGHEVTLSDRKELPAAVQRSFAGGETQCGKLVGDSTPGRHDCGFVV
jgi:UDP-glucose 4-epimerase